jgi:hypothetical protein
MSTDHQYGKLIFVCDTCEERIEFDPQDGFQTAWAQLKTEGWKTRKIRDEWVHGCPQCGV